MGQKTINFDDKKVKKKQNFIRTKNHIMCMTLILKKY